MLTFPLSYLVRARRIRKRAASFEFGNQHFLSRIEDRCPLCHEMHTAEDNHARGCRGGSLCETQRVTHKIGFVQDIGELLAVGQKGSIPFLL